MATAPAATDLGAPVTGAGERGRTREGPRWEQTLQLAGRHGRQGIARPATQGTGIGGGAPLCELGKGVGEKPLGRGLEKTGRGEENGARGRVGSVSSTGWARVLIHYSVPKNHIVIS